MPVERFSIDVSLIVKLSDLGAISPTLNELEISLTTKFAPPSPRLIFHSPFFAVPHVCEPLQSLRWSGSEGAHGRRARQPGRRRRRGASAQTLSWPC